MKKIELTLFSFLTFATSIFAQKIVPLSQDTRFLKDYVGRSYSSINGISFNTVTDILQTQDGYLYAGTYDGLNRFDGYEFVTLNKTLDPRYDFVAARSLFEDCDNNLWIGTNDEGIVCLKKDGSILKYSNEQGLCNNSVRAVVQDKDKNIWVGTYNGISCINSEFKIVTNLNTSLVDSLRITRLFCDSAGRIWIIAGEKQGLFLYTEGRLSRYTGLKSFSPNDVTFVTQDSRGAYWFGITPKYAVRKDEVSETIYNISESPDGTSEISGIIEDKSGNYWISTFNGVSVIHNNSISFFNIENGLADEKIVSITEDTEGCIWLATDRGGLQQLTKTKFKTTSLSTSVNAICDDPKRDCVWIAGDDGLYCYKNGIFMDNYITNFCKGVRIRHVAISQNNSLLVSTYKNLGQLEFLANGTINQWNHTNGLTGEKVRVALYTNNGDLYIGTTSGLFCVDKNSKQVIDITKQNNTSNSYIMCLFQDSENNLWCGTDGGGIFILDPKSRQVIRSYTTADGLAGNVIFKISKLNNNEIWITTGTGITRIKDNKFHNYTGANGLGVDGVFQVIEDSLHRVWCTSNKGLFYVPMSDFDSFANGTNNKLNAKYFGSSDGIISGGVNSTSLSMKDDFGRIWFTLIDGFSVYDPSLTNSGTKGPKIHVQEITLNNTVQEMIDEKQKIVIPANVNRISIKYTGISFVSSEKVQYQYKLVGFDSDYSEWTTERKVSYTNLKPGKYTFTIRAKNADETISYLEYPIEIIQKAAFYETIWFYLLILLISVLIITVAVNLKLHSINIQKKILEETVQARTKELTDLKDNLEIQVAERTKELDAEKKHAENLATEGYFALAETIDAKDSYTKGHSSRVAVYSVMLCEKLGLPKEDTHRIYYAAILHDIGKIGIKDSIINKPSKLDSDEYGEIKTHTIKGSAILTKITSLPEASIVARHHHERFDGKGYPDGLKGMEIPLCARIVCVADCYDAMTSNRSYRKYMPQDVVRAEIVRCSGTQFDPLIADKMLELIDSDTEYHMHEY